MSTSIVTVSGLTCGHCVNAVTEELTALSGVESVHVELVSGGTSTVTVASESPLVESDVRAAIDEAGYQFVALA